MVKMIDESQLRGQFVRIPRRIVTCGYWRHVWLEDGGAAGSACPVMALLCWGYGDRGARSSLIRLSHLSGVPTSTLQKAKRVLHRYNLVTPLSSTRRGVWMFRLGDALQNAELLPSFRFPGALVADGFWANSTPQARSLLVVMAALAQTVVEDAIEKLPSDAIKVLEEHDLIEEDFRFIGGDPEREGRVVRRFGHTAIDELRFLSGIGERDVWPALTELSSGFGPVFLPDEASRGLLNGAIWYYLPNDWWAPPGVGYRLDGLRKIRSGVDTKDL